MKAVLVLVCSLSIMVLDHPAEAEARLHFEGLGFSMMPLESTSDTVPHSPIVMSLPPTGGFAANVNVIISPFEGTMQEYVALSRQEFKAAGIGLLREEVSDTAVFFEYSHTAQGISMHWYSRGFLDKGKVYLVTATATKAQWNAASAKLKACVDSFRLESGEKSRELER